MNSTSSSRTMTRSVRFADTAQMYIVERHEDYGNNSYNVARRELWYTASNFQSMRRAIEQDVLQVRAQALAGVPFNYGGDDDASASASANESSVCCFGIENFLTANFMLEMEAAEHDASKRSLQSKQDEEVLLKDLMIGRLLRLLRMLKQGKSQ